MKLYVTVEEFLYAKRIENQTERTLRGYKNALNLFANWLQKEWTIDELEKIRVVHLKQYVAYHLKMGHKATYVNGIIKILRAFFKYTNGEDYTDIAYEKVAWVREEKPVIKAFSAQDFRFQLFLFSLSHLGKLGGFLVLLDHSENFICCFHC